MRRHTDNRLFCWGNNLYGQLGNWIFEDSSKPVRTAGGRLYADVGVGQDYACGLTTGGAAYCWGRNNGSNLGDGSFGDRSTPSAVAGGREYRSIAAGVTHSCAVAQSGMAYCWGNNWRAKWGAGPAERVSHSRGGREPLRTWDLRARPSPARSPSPPR